MALSVCHGYACLSAFLSMAVSVALSVC
eukprot:COSAG02_NODE_70915_length_193_cov_34.968085_1_plen_27_part_10